MSFSKIGLLLCLTAGFLTAQNPGRQVIYATLVPTGACGYGQIRVVMSTGIAYTCDNGTWAAATGSGGSVGGAGNLTNAGAIVCTSSAGVVKECGGGVTAGATGISVSNSLIGQNKVAGGTSMIVSWCTDGGNPCLFPVVALSESGGVIDFGNGGAVGDFSASWKATNGTLTGTLNNLTLTAPATAATLTIANNKTLTANNSLTLAGTDSTTMTFPSTSATVARTDAGQTFTGNEIFSGTVNKITFTAPATAWTVTPAADNQTTTLSGGSITAAVNAWGASINQGAQFTGSVNAIFVPDTAITIVRVTAYATTAAVTCSTAPVLTICDKTVSAGCSTGPSQLQSLTLANGTNSFDSGVISVPVTSGDTLQPNWTTTASGCGTIPSGVSFQVEYR